MCSCSARCALALWSASAWARPTPAARSMAGPSAMWPRRLTGWSASCAWALRPPKLRVLKATGGLMLHLAMPRRLASVPYCQGYAFCPMKAERAVLLLRRYCCSFSHLTRNGRIPWLRKQPQHARQLGSVCVRQRELYSTGGLYRCICVASDSWRSPTHCTLLHA